MKKLKIISSYLLSFVMFLSLIMISPCSKIEVKAADGRVEAAVQWALGIAADDKHGYSMENRNGNPDYDCSSLVCYAFKNAGFNVPITSTPYMRAAFKNVGFEWIEWSKIGNVSNLKRGDILLNELSGSSGHTEIYLGNNQMVGAHGGNKDGKQGDYTYGTEISYGPYSFNSGRGWHGILRYGGSLPDINDLGEPSYSDFHVGELWDGGFTVMAKVTDPSGISQVKYAIWTEKGEQDDIMWYQGHCTDNNDYYWSRINFSDHNGEKGKYIIHMYAYDNAGNLANPGISYIFDVEEPSYTDFHVGELWDGGFTVMAKVTDPNGISQVKYAIWTEKGEQDDIIWYQGHCTDNNDYYWSRINFSEHNGEKGKYIIHMYAYDNAGNLANPGIYYNFDSSGPTCTDFHVGEFWEGGFTVMAKVTDPNGISQVKYAIWTEKDEQDDIIWYQGNCTDNNDYYWSRINFSDYKGEKGKYIIHLYAYDSAGKAANPGISYIFKETGPQITNVSVSDISLDGYTVSCEVNDVLGIDRVQFPTWTVNDDQDDIVSDWNTNKKVRGTINGNTVTFRVNTSEHNNETGMYRTHIYAYDILGNPSSFGVPDVYVHNHTMEITNEISPLCFDSGLIEKTCSDCGYVITEEIPATGHIWNTEYTVDKNANCIEEGSESIHCSVCDIMKENSSHIISKTQHKYGEWKTTKEATYTEQGLKERECTVCGTVQKEMISKKVNRWISPISIENVEYGTKPEPKAEAAYGEIVYKYCDTLDGEYQTTYPENVGLYYVKAYAAESDLDNNLESEPVSFSIQQSEYIMNMIRFENREFVYDSKEKGLEIEGTLPIGVKVSYIGNAKKDVGTYTVTAKFTGDSNHKEIPDMTAELTILPVSVKIPERTTLNYTGEELSVLESNEMIDVVSGATGTEIGTYEMVLALKDVNNSVWVDGTTGNQTVKWEIVNGADDDDPQLPDETDIPEAEATTENPAATEQSVTEEKTTETSQTVSEGEQPDSEENLVSSEEKEAEPKTTDEKNTEEQADILKPEETTEPGDRVTTEGKTEKQADIPKSEEATGSSGSETTGGEKRTTQETTITEDKDTVPVQPDEEKKTLPADQVTGEKSQDIPGTIEQGTSTEENREGDSTSGTQEKSAEEKETQKPVEQNTQQNTTESVKTVPAAQGSTEKAVQKSTQAPSSSSAAKTTQDDKKAVTKQTAETTKQDEGLDVGDTVEVGICRYTVTDDGEAAITGITNNKAKKVTIPDTITVQNQTFAVTEISDGTFANSSIVKAVIGNNIKTIGESSFKNCKKLSSVTLGKNVDTIGKNAFKNCKALKKIVLPENLEEIGNSAFSGCKKLANITINSSKLLIVEKNAFKGIKKTAKITVPRKKLAKYKKLLKNKGQSRTVTIR